MAIRRDFWPLDEDQSAFMQSVGLQLEVMSSEEVRGYLDLDAAHHQPFGIVHGGVYCAAVEAAASMGAAMTAAERGLATTGVNNNTHYIRAVEGGRLDVVATPIQQGGTQQLWEVRITDDEGRIVALGQVRLQNIPMPG
jgi:1,4-dihydroxy-2-naphthoyl-CoA hydrolase